LHSDTVTPLGRAPFVPVLLTWSAALYLYGNGFPASAAVAVSLILLILVICLAASMKRPPGFWTVVLLLAAVSVSGASFLLYRLAPTPPRSLNHGAISLQGVVTGERAWGGKRAVTISTGGCDYFSEVWPRISLREGEKVTVHGTIRPLDPELSADEFDADAYWGARGMDGEIENPELVSSKSSEPGIHSWRTLLRIRMIRTLPPLLRGHLEAAWLGVRDPLVADLHRKWGTSHLLAVSGFHVGIVVSLVFLLAGGWKYRRPFASAVLWFYVLLAGAAASALRAALMIQSAFLGAWLGRPASPLNGVAIAAGALLLWNPLWFWDLGWRLSVTAALLLSALSQERSALVWIIASPLVWFATAPLIAGSFGSVPMAGLLVNPLALPVFGILLPAASVLAVPALVGAPGGAIMARAAEMMIGGWANLADMISLAAPWSTGDSHFLHCAAAGLTIAVVFRGAGFGSLRSLAVMVCIVVLAVLAAN